MDRCAFEQGRARRRSERGATFTEYAFLAAVVVASALAAITILEDESGSYLTDTGSDIGTPRELAGDIDPDLPEAPDWLPQPPAPATSFYTGALSTAIDAANCYQPATPGVSLSPIISAPCTGGPEQEIDMAGAPTDAVITFTDAANTGLCFTESVDRVILANCDGTDSQLFTIQTNPDTSKSIVGRTTGLCLTIDPATVGTELLLAACDASDPQKFTV